MTDLLDLSPRTRGRAARPPKAEVIRDLTPADLDLLQAPRDSHAPRVLRFRDSHHRVAMCFASGMTPRAVAAQTGYSLSRLSILQADPAFKDLIQTYRASSEATYAEFTDIALGNMVRAERIVEDSLEAIGDREAPLDPGELRPLLDIISDRADRFGYPKRTQNLNINVDFAGRLEAARRRSGLSPHPPTPGLIREDSDPPTAILPPPNRGPAAQTIASSFLDEPLDVAPAKEPAA